MDPTVELILAEYERRSADEAKIMHSQPEDFARRTAAMAYQARVRTKPDLDSVLLPIGSGVELSRKHELGPRP